MPVEFPGEIARLIPRNETAKRLFSNSHVFTEKNDPFHLNFIVFTDIESYVSEELVESSTEYDSYHEGEDSASTLHVGYFVISLDNSHLPEKPHLGWRMGRGFSKFKNRNVDIFPAKPGDGLSKSFASNHFRLAINPQSGFLLLQPAAKDEAILECNINGSWKSLKGRDQLMYQQSTTLRVGRGEYDLVYTIEERHRDAYIEQRDGFIRTWLSPQSSDIYQEFSKIPVPGDDAVVRGRYLEFDRRGYGTFGWVNQGVDTHTGNLIAIKELQIRNQRSWPAIKAELDVGRRFSGELGLLPILDACCEHGHPEACCTSEKFFMYLPLALSDLSANFWFDPSIEREAKLRLLREILQGLAKLHETGFMHRDIHPQNMSILSLKPPRASICDYGTAIQADTSTVTTIGPTGTLAPEVWVTEIFGPYTKSIDMWAYGYAIADILGYSTMNYRPPGDDVDSKITPQRHRIILAMLSAYAETNPEDYTLVELALKLLVWDAKKRLTAVQALEHRCWDPIMPEIQDDEYSSGVKRAKVGEAAVTEGPVSGFNPHPLVAALNTDLTQAFPQETWNSIHGRKTFV